MKETKFTPGPWTAELGEVHEVRDAEGGRICILTQLRGRHGLGGRRADHESPANARLIAAAPELYDALMNTFAYITGLEHFGVKPEGVVEPDMEVVRAALAKAGQP